MFCRAFLPEINQWVRLSLEPGGEAFHQLEIRTLYWSRSPCMFDITEASLFLVTLGSQSIPISIEHRGVSSLQRQNWEVMCFCCSRGSFFSFFSTHLSYHFAFLFFFFCNSLTVLTLSSDAVDFQPFFLWCFVLLLTQWSCGILSKHVKHNWLLLNANVVLLKQLNSDCYVFLKIL